MTNLVNPTRNPIVDEYLRRAMGNAGNYLGQAARDPVNLGKGMAAGLLGLSGDVQELGNYGGNALLGLLSKQPVTGPLAASLLNYQGRSGATSQELGQAFGADLGSPGYQVGEIGAPDMNDLFRHGLLGMTLFHGTPHKFDKFDLAHIGRGEGAQAFGYGLYFAENPKVAGQYKEALSDSRQVFKVDGKTVDIDSLEPTDPVEAMAIRSLGQPDLYKPETLPQRLLDDDADPAFVSRLSRRLEELKGRVNFEQEQFGHLYEVDIDDSVIDQMLDWDAPLSEQPESVRKAIDPVRLGLRRADYKNVSGWVDEQGRLVGPALKVDGPPESRTFDDEMLRKWWQERMMESPTAKDFYQRLNDPETASRLLNEAGIPGIRFYDGGSRNVGKNVAKRTTVNGTPILKFETDDYDLENLLQYVENGEPLSKVRQIAAEQSDELLKKFDALDIQTGEGTRNIVVFDPDSSIKSVKRDGKLVYEAKYRGAHTAPLRKLRATALDGGNVDIPDNFLDDINNTEFFRGLDASADKGERIGKYFTNDPSTAYSYTGYGEKRGLNRARFNVQDPLVVDYGGRAKSDRLDNKYLRQAREQGKDAVVFLNIADAKGSGYRGAKKSLLEMASSGTPSTVVIPLKDDAIQDVSFEVIKQIKRQPRTVAEKAASNAEADKLVAEILRAEGLSEDKIKGLLSK